MSSSHARVAFASASCVRMFVIDSGGVCERQSHDNLFRHAFDMCYLEELIAPLESMDYCYVIFDFRASI